VLNNTLPKKIWEAKARKKKRFVESLKKAQKKSEQVFDNEAYTPLAKARQVREIYKKAMNNSKPKQKEIIVGNAALLFCYYFVIMRVFILFLFFFILLLFCYNFVIIFFYFFIILLQFCYYESLYL
jgi:Flp pilus assembly protein TadB